VTSHTHQDVQDIGIASPLYDLANMIGIRDSVYQLPIHLVPWSVPYPIGVPWPVIAYHIEQDASTPVRDRDCGYVVVAPGGKAQLWVYGKNEVREVSPHACELHL